MLSRISITDTVAILSVRIEHYAPLLIPGPYSLASVSWLWTEHAIVPTVIIYVLASLLKVCQLN